MSIEVVKGTIHDYEEILDFANYVFHEREGFDQLLPKVYNHHPETARHHYLIKEDRRIVAMVGAFPQTFLCGTRTLSAVGIGTVTTNPYRRDRGYMRLLMQAAMEEQAAKGADFAYLSGLRQRYERYGFAKAGVQAIVEFNGSNGKAVGDAALPYRFAPLEGAGDAALDAAVAAHDRRFYHAVRPRAQFAHICYSYNTRPYAVFHEDEPIGYLCYRQEDRTVSECYVEHGASTMLPVIAAFHASLALGKTGIRVHLFPDQFEALPPFTRVCESFSWAQIESFHIFRYPEMLEATLALAQHVRPRPDAKLTLAIEGEPAHLELCVHGGQTSVTPTDAPADLTLTRLDALTHLFSTATFANPHPLLPLPLFMLRGDEV